MFQIHSLVQVGCERAALSPQQQCISSFPMRRSARTLPQSAPPTQLVCRVCSSLCTMICSSFCFAFCTLPHSVSPRQSSPLSGSQLTCHGSTCSLMTRGVGQAGRQEGRRDANMRKFGLPVKQQGCSLQHSTHSFGSVRRTSVWPRN